MADPRWRPIAALLFLFLGGTNAVLALLRPEAGEKPGLHFAVAGLIRVLALIAISVAALRIATASPRRTWMPDAGFWAYLLMGLAGLAAAFVGALLGAPYGNAVRIPVTEVVGAAVGALLAVWGVALAVERPLALSPAPRFRNLAAWLPHLLLWSLLLVVPIACLHAWLSLRLVQLSGSGSFWPLALADALASSLLVLLMLALQLAAYRRVARRTGAPR
ncbi:MAG TPA: hypothetical protein VHM92_02045 [Allosphingosinicella sp.]|nr:hypothetical protein [Allosphingosinicella sp.]